MTTSLEQPRYLHRLRLYAGVLGISVATACFIWLLAGWIGWVPGMVDVFGVAGMRIPAAICIGALLLAAISFWEY